MVTELDIQCDGGEGPWILNDNNKAFSIDKYSHMILNPLYVDVNSKTLLTKLQNQLSKDALLMTEEVADIVNRLHAFYYSLEFGYPLSIQHKLEIGTAELIKLGSFNFEFNRTGDIMDFMSYIEVVDTLLSPMVYIMVNLDLVLNDEIFPELIQKDCEAKNIEKHMKKILENLPEIEEKIENMRKKIEGKAVVESYADFLIKEGK